MKEQMVTIFSKYDVKQKENEKLKKQVNSQQTQI